jgi:hypothetical protein
VTYYDPELAKFGNAVSPFVRMPSFEAAHLASQRRFEDRYGSWMDQPTATDWLEATLDDVPSPYVVGGPESHVVGDRSMTPTRFAQELLAALGMPQSDNNIRALVAAQAVEGGHMHNSALFNPLNTTLRMPGSGAVTKIGVQAFTDWNQGVEATAKTLTNGLYSGILGALRRSAPPDETLREFSRSPWGWGGKIVGPASSFQSYGMLLFPSIGLVDAFVTRSNVKQKLITTGIVLAATASLTFLTYVLVRRARTKSGAGKESPGVLPRT